MAVCPHARTIRARLGVSQCVECGAEFAVFPADLPMRGSVRGPAIYQACNANYQRRVMNEEHKAKLSAINRARWGAPDGMATLHGVHIPIKYRAVLKFCALRIYNRMGPEGAREFVQGEADANWAGMPALTEIYNRAQLVRENKQTIKEIESEGLNGRRTKDRR